MSITPSNQKEIFFNYFSLDSVKKNICNCVFDKIKEENITILKNLRYNYSHEGGVELPKTYEWNNYLDNHPIEQYRSLHKYQSSRQLRFIKNADNYIIGARCKDSINLFTDDELNKISELFETVLQAVSED